MALDRWKRAVQIALGVVLLLFAGSLWIAATKDDKAIWSKALNLIYGGFLVSVAYDFMRGE